MSTSNLFISLLENSKTEQQAIRLFLTHTVICGIVSNLYPDTVEVRTESGKRCFALLEKLEAIETA